MLRMCRSKYGLILLGLLVLFGLMIGHELYSSLRVAKVEATTDARNLSQVLASRLNFEFNEAERVVSMLAKDINPAAMRREQVPRYQAEITHWLQSHRHAITSASALRIFDAQGNRIYSSMGEQVPINIADRAFFKEIVRDPKATLVSYSDVLIGRYSHRASMYISQPVLAADGTFLGAAIAIIDVSTLQEELQKIDLGSDGLIALRRMGNGAVVIRYPGMEEIQNKPEPTIPVRLAILRGGPSGALEVVSPLDGIRRILGYQVLDNQQMFVMVGLAERTYLAGWRDRALVLGGASLAFVLILAAVFYRLARMETTRMLSEQALRESEERFRTIADYTYDWEYWLSPEGCVLYVSPACERVSGYTPDEFYTDPALLERILLPEDAAIYRTHLQSLDDQPESHISFRIVRKDGGIRWIAHGCRQVMASDGRDLGRRVNNRDITELKLAEQRAHALAFFDVLTGLPNRRMLLDRLDQALLHATRFQRALAVMFIDVDHFKEINDRFGHDAGDTLLCQIATRLVACVRSVDTVSRSGGDEFIVVLTELADPQDARLVAEKMGQAFEAPIPFGQEQLKTSLSIGIAIRSAEDSDGAATLMRRADMAMYAIKSAGRNGYRVWSANDTVAPM